MGIQLIDNYGRTFDVNDSRITIGADKTNGVVLDDLAASGTTLELVQEGSQWQLKNSGSMGSVLVNGTALNGTLALRHNDVIQAGGTSLRFLDWNNAGMTAAPQQGAYQPAQGNYPAQPYQMAGISATPSKDRTAAALLAILLGGIGVHHFYLGHIGLGILYLLFSWTGIPLIVGIVEGIIMFTTSDQAWLQKYPPV